MYLEVKPGEYIAVEHIISVSLSESAGYAEIITDEMRSVSNEDGATIAASRVHKVQDSATVKTLRRWLDARLAGCLFGE